MFRRRSRNKPNENSGLIHQRTAKAIEIGSRGSIRSVAFLADGKQIVGGGYERKIRCWRVKDGREVGKPMDAGNTIFNIAVSPDAKWIVSGERSGLVTVWRADSHEKAHELRGHDNWVCAVDISPDGTRVATGSGDRTVRIWSLPTGEQQLSPLEHDYYAVAVKISPNGLFIATATWRRKSIRIYDSQNGNLLVDVPVEVKSNTNEPLAWARNSIQLFVLSHDGDIICLNASTGATISRWSIHGNSDPLCIALAGNGRFIAAANASSVSFWDTSTHAQIGSVIQHTDAIESMAISPGFDLGMGGGNKITCRKLRNILPSHYFDVPGPEETIQSPQVQGNSHASRGTLELIHASDAVLKVWREDKLLEAIDILSRDKKLNGQRHHTLATRAFLRARLRQWDSAMKNARKSIKTQPTILAYVALSMARFGRGHVDLAKKTFNRLFHKCDVIDVCFITLIKVIVMFTSGFHEEGLARVADLIAVCSEQDIAWYRAVQAQMRVIAAKTCLGRREHDKMLELLADTRDPPQFPLHPRLECISLMFGWTNDPVVFGFMFHQQRCEALFALRRQKDAAELLDTISRDFEGLSGSRNEVKEWLQSFTGRLVAPDNTGEVESTAFPSGDSFGS